jgi:hypothetical protein
MAKFVDVSSIVANQFATAMSVRNAFDGLDAELGIAYMAGIGSMSGGRLALSAASPIATGDISSGFVYLVAYSGNYVVLLDTAINAWRPIGIGTASVSLSGIAAGTNVDIFASANTNGTVMLTAIAWTNSTTRATALTRVNGVWCMAGTANPGSHLYLGTVRTTSLGTCAQVASNSVLWNQFNRVNRGIVATEAADSWTYATGTWRAYNGGGTPTARVNAITGDAGSVGIVRGSGYATATGGVHGAIGIGVNSTTAPTGAPSGAQPGSSVVQLHAPVNVLMPIGWNAIHLLEVASGATVTFYGDNGALSGLYQAGISAVVEC